MKYTIPQILKFTAMVHSTEMSKVGGRSGYLLDGNKKHLSTGKHLGYSFLIFSLIFIGSLIVLTQTILWWDQQGMMENIFILGTIVALIAFGIVGQYHELYVSEEDLLMRRSTALKYEPEELWTLNYPEHLGQKAELIRSLLGARLISRKMTHDTSIPMDNTIVDVRIANLVKEIMKCKDKEVHPYLIDETKSFCKQTIKDFNFYTPLISLQEELKQLPTEQGILSL